MEPRLCLPDGPVSVMIISGTPDTLHVKAIEPFANAASGRPDGARVTVNVSTTSAYISLEVCRTLARRHGRAGVFVVMILGAPELVNWFLLLVRACQSCGWNMEIDTAVPIPR